MKTPLLSLLMTFGFAVHAGPVEIMTSPSKPIVFNYDMSYQDLSGKIVNVKAPWFQFKVNMKNLAADPLTIVALHVEVTGKDANGNSVTTVKDISPSTFNHTNPSMTCLYADFGLFDINALGNLRLTPSDTSSATCPGGDMNFIVDGNPPVQGSSSVIEYSVKIQPIGYFQDAGGPKARFDEFITISTQ